MLAYFADNPARQAICNNICGDILSYKASRSDNGIVSDGNAGKYAYICPYPAVFADVNGHIVLILNLLPQL